MRGVRVFGVAFKFVGGFGALGSLFFAFFVFRPDNVRFGPSVEGFGARFYRVCGPRPPFPQIWFKISKFWTEFFLPGSGARRGLEQD